MDKPNKREWSAWILGIIASIIAIASAWNAYHDQFETAGAARATAIESFFRTKSSLRGRLSSYDRVPEEELTPFEKDMKSVIEHDLRELEMEQEQMGLSDG